MAELNIVFVTRQRLVGNTLFVKYSDGSVKTYDAVKLGCKWFQMSNDAFFRIYGFNFNPCEYAGLYEKCRKIVHGV